MSASDWITVAALVLGPIIAVSITLWIEARRRSRETKLITLRLLLTTRDLPSDPTFQTAVKLIPIEFNECTAVMSAHAEFLLAAGVPTEGKSEDEVKRIGENTSVKLVRLIYEMGRAVGLNIRETDIQTGAFGTRGFFYRDALLQDSQKAMRDIANILWMQTRLAAGESWDQIVGTPTTNPQLDYENQV